MVTPALFHKVRHKWDLQEWKTISLLFILTSNRFVILTSLSLLSALISFSFSFFFFATLRGMQDLSSATRNCTQAPCNGSVEP